MTRIIAYTYDADIHCPACAYRLFGPGRESVPAPGLTDEHGIPYRTLDREGNAVHPVFSTDELYDTHCGDCRQQL